MSNEKKTAKTQEELAQIKKEFEAVTQKLKELSEEELAQVTGGRQVRLQPVIELQGVVHGVQYTQPNLNQ